MPLFDSKRHVPCLDNHHSWPALAGADPRDALERGGGRGDPPLRPPSLCPGTVSLTASASFNGICNRQ